MADSGNLMCDACRPGWRCGFSLGSSLAVGLVVFLFPMQVARAETINFYCPANKTNLSSDGLDMTAGYSFHLGVFSSGFTPTRDNRSMWLEHWNPVAGGAYVSSSSSFNFSHTVTGNSPPFSVGSAAYVWGRRTSVSGDEWILFRKSNWTWPAPNPLNPIAQTWNASLADQVVIGTIHASGSPFLMQSEAVLSYDQWQTVHLSGEPLDGSGDDPDSDGVTNLLEFVFGTPPLMPGPPPLMPVTLVESGGQTYQQVSIPRLQNRLASLTVEVSGNLSLWQSGATETTVVSSTAGSLVVRDLTPLGPGQAQRFMRLKAVLP